MAVDLYAVFRRGGKELIALLDYCVRSVQLEPVFVFLVSDYRTGPTALKAVALYEVFCAPDSKARLKAPRALPPLDLRLQTSLHPLQQWWQQRQAAPPTLPELTPPPLPAKHLFDSVVHELEASADSSLRTVSESYDPTRTPIENLPGGKMTSGQRYFVEKVWEPALRPQLVRAGFWRLATIA